MLFYYITTIILTLTAAFLMWFFIFGRRSVTKEDRAMPGQKGAYFVSAILCVLIALLLTYDVHQFLTALERYGNRDFLHLLFYPVSALAVVFAMIPGSVVSVKKETQIPGVSMILFSGLFMLLLNLLCICVIHDHETMSASLCYLICALLCCLCVYYTPQLSRDRYRAELETIDRMVSEARNAHYEAVKKSSYEIRRSRHDMKNHMIALRELAQQERTEELIKYIDSITEQIDAAAPPYRSGNDIADVIIADKHAKAEKRGIGLHILGDLAGLDIESADLVTILSNLLDNAIEAVSRLYGKDLSEEDKTIRLEFRKNANFLLILETNKSIEKVVPGKIVSSKNSPDHGFGIGNIRRAVKKYGGEYNIGCSEEGDLYLVQIEIVLPLNNE